MREIRTSGLMSGDGKRATASRSRTAPILDSTEERPTSPAGPGMITPCPPTSCGPRGGSWGGQLKPSTSGQVLVSADVRCSGRVTRHQRTPRRDNTPQPARPRHTHHRHTPRPTRTSATDLQHDQRTTLLNLLNPHLELQLKLSDSPRSRSVKPEKQAGSGLPVLAPAVGEPLGQQRLQFS